jgi:S-adenosylmethionine:tRNA ribosyltransferase-isomerase
MKSTWLEKAESINPASYTYQLDDDRVARYPNPERDQSKLIVYENGSIGHFVFSDIAEHIPAHALLVFNDTRVIPARAHFQKDTGAVIEILLLHPEQPTRIVNDAMLVRNNSVWECMIGNKKRWKVGDTLTARLTIGERSVTLAATYADYENNQVKFSWNSEHVFLDIVQALGKIPLPPYLNRETEESDILNYQTVYARQNGAVAAPTAGLHFTERTFSAMQEKGIDRSFVTLHVGAGTFQPVKVDSVTAHPMHSEQVVYSRSLVQDLIQCAELIIPVGTTSMRSLESLYWYGVKLLRRETAQFLIEKLYPYPFEETELPSASDALHAVADFMDQQGLNELVGETEIFIFPGYTFRLCRGLITNFHQPGSTLILLVAALIGDDWKKVYASAIENGYRFLSYGDSSLLWGKS